MQATPVDQGKRDAGGRRLLIAGTIEAELAVAILQREDAAVQAGAARPRAILALADPIAPDRIEALGWGGRIVSVAADAFASPGWIASVATAAGDDGIDALVCRFDEVTHGWLDELTPAAWLDGLRANALPSWLLVQAVVPLLAQHGGGSVVALTTRAVAEAVPGAGSYGTGKVLEAMLLRNAGVEAAAQGVRVNLLRLSPPSRAGHQPAGAPEDAATIADAVAFLIDDASRGINAAIVPTDGGTAVAAPTRAQFGLPARQPVATPADGARRLRAIITGGAGRIGVESALALHREAIADGRDGLSILVADRNTQMLAEVTARLSAAGIEAVGTAADLGDPDTPARLVEEAVAHFGGLDLIHSNAALGINDTVLAAGREVFERIVTINIDATWRFARAAAPHLAASGGSLIATSSIASLNANGRAPLYAATKAALTMMIAQLALEWAGKGIRANVICPGSIDTPMNQLSSLPPGERARIAATFPTPRLGVAEEVGAAVAFLASRGASYITGQNLVVDGGLASALR